MKRGAGEQRRGKGAPPRPGRERGTEARAGRSAMPLAPAPDPRHPAFIFAAIVAAACIAVSVSFVLFDTDMWQHFAVGKAIWQLRQVPTCELWTWPTYGAPDVNASWGFRALIWPIWHAFGIPGLFAWRWASTLALFGLLWIAARRMGATGLTPLFIMAWCAVTYRARAHIRPETLATLFLAAEIWILETWRARERCLAADPGAAANAPGDHRPWLVLIACAWANVHISYWMGLAVQAIYFLGAWPDGRTSVSAPLERAGWRGWRAPVAIGLASAAASFLNPWGWRALSQPFEYFLYWRHEAVYRTIAELTPIDWTFSHRALFPELLAVGALLLIWRTRARGVDPVEWLMLGLFVPLGLMTVRFVGLTAAVMAPFVARDLDDWMRSRAWARPAAAGDGAAGGRRWANAIVVAGLCVAVSLPEWTRPSMPLGIAIDWRSAPVRACDFLAAHDIRGRGMNQFAAGGYMVYRFWPDRWHLPFMDIHQTGTRDDRYYYAWAQQDSLAWTYLDDKHRFDYTLLFTHQSPNDSLLDVLGADSTHWALVFTDDAGAVFLRRDGPFASLADRMRYRLLPAGRRAYNPALAAAASDSVLRRRLTAEWERAAASSPWNNRARMALAFLADAENREADATRILDDVLRDQPLILHAHEYRAEIELGRGDARAAIADLRAELVVQAESAELDFELGRAWQMAGDLKRARASWQRAEELSPGRTAARDSLARLDAPRP